jgi:hypothetical protein
VAFKSVPNGLRLEFKGLDGISLILCLPAVGAALWCYGHTSTAKTHSREVSWFAQPVRSLYMMAR